MSVSHRRAARLGPKLEESIWLRPGNDVMARLRHLAHVRDLDLHEFVRLVLRLGLERVEAAHSTQIPGTR